MRYIRLDENNLVVSVRNGPSIVEGEIESDIGDLGQIRQPDGTFITPEPSSAELQPSMDEIQTQILLNTEYLVIISEISTT